MTSNGDEFLLTKREREEIEREIDDAYKPVNQNSYWALRYRVDAKKLLTAYDVAMSKIPVESVEEK